jgi:hypothetical protein
MNDRRLVVFGVYSNRQTAAKALDQFESAGFLQADISVLLSGEQGATEIEDIKSREPKGVGEKLNDLTSKETKDISSGKSADFAAKNSKAPQGAAAGAGIGAALGGSLGWVAALSVLAIPGLGPLLIAGPLLGAFAGAVAGGAVGVLVGVGIPEDEAKLYEERLKKGGVLVSAHAGTPEDADRARNILQRTGATDIATTYETNRGPVGTGSISRSARS